MGLIESTLGWLATALLGMVIGRLGTLVKRARGQDKAMKDGMCVLLRARLIELHERYVEQGEPCPVDVKSEADQTYAAYHSLGGNGTGTHLHEEIMDAHIASHAPHQSFGHPSGWPTAIGSQEDI